MSTFKTWLLPFALLLTPWMAGAAQSPSAPGDKVVLQHLGLVVLDPGHGGANQGCLGVDGTYEKHVVLEISRRVARILRSETTARVRLTRTADRFLGLRERARLANQWGADVLLSMHLNADPYGAGHGVETWHLAHDAADAEAKRMVEREEGHAVEFLADGARLPEPHLRVLQDASLRRAQEDSSVLAELVHDGMHQATRARARGVKQAPFGVLKEAHMPAIVVEAGFFSHPDQGMDLLSPRYQEQVARGIVDGLVAFDARIGGDARPHRGMPHRTAEAQP